MSEKTKHTPGPWSVGFSDGSGASKEGGYTITAGDHPAIRDTKNVVVVVRSGKDDWGVTNGIDNEANARLIAAAPELLAFALKAVTAAMEGRKLSKAEHAEARAAIAKAGGHS